MRSNIYISILLNFAASFWSCRAGTPSPALFFEYQLVNHLEFQSSNWTQRYYVWEDAFQGPGSPIFVILGGEGAIEPESGLLYPFITHHLAPSFGAYVLQPEHRFYGASQPIPRDEIDQARAKGQEDPRVQLLTSEQALYDAIRLLKHVKSKLGCDLNSTSYCPVITVGGSYPGFLSAMARLVFPDVIDMAYAASAPMEFYSQTVSPTAYYQHITAVAEQASPGCAAAVKSSLTHVRDFFRHNVTDFAKEAVRLGLCEETLPSYIQDTNSFLEEVFMVVGYTFANHNMAYYPPSNHTRLYKACQTFLKDDWTPLERLENFLLDSLVVRDWPSTGENSVRRQHCVDLRSQLPTGFRATISSGDWSGVGSGRSGESWDFQTCTLLVEAISFGEDSMFPERPWSLNWLQQHCQARFGVTPQPWKLVNQWKWDKLVEAGASRILFTNGLNDGWSVSGIQQNLSPDLLALNFPFGAHHSDLSGKGPSEDDTDDIRLGFAVIENILDTWVKLVKGHNDHRFRRRDPIASIVHWQIK